jgi:hypothetical protein
MRRLFGLSAVPRRVRVTFWLPEVPDSLARQSRRVPDGAGLGVFTDDRSPEVDKQPLAAYQDQQFVQEAKERESTTFPAHIRYASTGGLDPATLVCSSSKAGWSRTTASSRTFRPSRPGSATTAGWSPATPTPSGASP